MLTLNENSAQKSTNFKKLAAVMSSVAVIGVGATYLLSSDSKSSNSGTNLSSFFDGDIHGDFDIEMFGEGELKYTANGHFSKTMDENNEWDVEYFHKGAGFGANSYFLKDGSQYQAYSEADAENQTYVCAGQEDNLGYAQYKYNLINAQEVDKTQLSVEVVQSTSDVCNDDAKLYVIENDDFGSLVICPTKSTDGYSVGVVSRSFKGRVATFNGKRTFELPENVSYQVANPCGKTDKFRSQLDLTEKEDGRSSESLEVISTREILRRTSTFPFPKVRKLEDETSYSNGGGGGTGSGTSGGFGNLNSPTGNNDGPEGPQSPDTSWQDSTEDGTTSKGPLNEYLNNPDWVDPGKDNENTQRRSKNDWLAGKPARSPNNTEALDCQVVHGAGNNKGYKRKHNIRSRFAHVKYDSTDNDDQGYNSRAWQPCWVYDNLILTPKVKAKQAHGSSGGTHGIGYIAGSNFKNDRRHHDGYQYPGYNFYWGKNMLLGGVPGMANSEILLDECTWTTFSDYNSNQLTYKDPSLGRQIAKQICGNVWCFAGVTGSYKALVLAHSMGVLMILQTLFNGFWKKGPRATIGLVSGPIKGSIGAHGVEAMCKTNWMTAITGSLTGFMTQSAKNIITTGTLSTAFLKSNAIGIVTSLLKDIVANLAMGMMPPQLMPWILDITSSCDGNKTGGIGVIAELKLFSHYYNDGPKFFTKYNNFNKLNVYYDHGLVDYRLCGLTPNGLDSNPLMKWVTKTGCIHEDFCFQQICENNQNSGIYFVCNYRGCKNLPKGYNCPRSTLWWSYNWIQQQDNHVSRHSCEADSRYFNGELQQNGGFVSNSHANHKNICCKVGNGSKLAFTPCNWYQMLAGAANSI